MTETIKERVDTLFNSECSHVGRDDLRLYPSAADCPRCIIEMVQAALAEAKKEMAERCAGLPQPIEGDNLDVGWVTPEYLKGWADHAAACRALGEKE